MHKFLHFQSKDKWMYFVTNSEKYIVAADKDFLGQLGAKSVCTVSSYILDGLLSKDSDGRLSIAGLKERFQVTSSDLHSPFGELKLYQVTAPKLDIEDENINYIKKIKDGTITAVDHEFNIPQISTKEEANPKESTAANESDFDKVAPRSEIEETSADLTKQTQQSESTLEIAKEESAIELLDDTIANEMHKVEHKSKELEESLEKSTDWQVKLLEESAQEQAELKQASLEESSIAEKAAETTEEIEEKIETIDTPATLLEAKQPESADNETTLDKEKGLGLFKSKIFPWGSKGDEEIELEEEVQEKDVLKVANELEAKQKEQEDIKSEDTLPVIDIDYSLPKSESAASKGTISNEEPLAKTLLKAEKSEEAKLPKSEDTITEVAKEQPESMKEAEAVLMPLDSSIKEGSEAQVAKEAKETIMPKEASVNTVSSQQKIAIANTEELKEPAKEEVKETDSSIAQESKQEILIPVQEPKEEMPSQEELELIELKKISAEQKLKETQKVSEPLEVAETNKVQEAQEPQKVQKAQKIHKEAKQTDNRLSDSAKNQIYYKLIHMQADGVNLEENAKHLSIDLESYKMLLSNYLDELDNYLKELKSASQETVMMLTDASELLSLGVMTKKLQKLLTAQDKPKALQEITLLQSLLRKKLNSDQEQSEAAVVKQATAEQNDSLKQTIQPKVTQSTKTNTEPKQPQQPIIEEVEITSAQDLLEKIDRADIAFDPDKAASELNLPSSLIVEFVVDFIDQTQEHLPQMVKAYKERDVKTMQTTAHMLKGAASNLRLDALSESLFKIQNIQAIEQSEKLLKDFVAKLKGLKYTVEHMETAENEN